MAKDVNPALFVGLGGTGYKIALQLKKALITNYGEMPPVVKILCFDTDVSPLTSEREKLTYTDVNGNRVTKEIGLDEHEYIAIPVKSPDKLLKFKHISSWLSDKISPSITPGDNGAKQIRSQGRFAFFENFNSQKIGDKIKDKIEELEQVEVKKHLGYNVLGNPRVHLIFSPCGGTGAGTFLDMALLIKSLREGLPLYAWMVMPDFYTKYAMTTNVVKNGYASLVEIDHMMGKDAAPGKKWSNYPKEPYEVDYTGSGNKITLGTNKFFDYIYLFDNKMENGGVIKDVDDAYDMIGRILYLMVSGPGDQMLTSYSNNVDFNYPSSPETGGKRRNYSSMGLSQIILDKEYISELKINRISKSILNAFLNHGNNIDEKEFDTFIDSNNWREDRGQDQVIDRLFPQNGLNYDSEAVYPPEFKKECNVELVQSVDLWLKEWDTRVKTECTPKVDELYSDFAQKLNKQIAAYLQSEGGLPKCEQAISYLSGSFNGMRDEMDSEGVAHKSNIDQLKANVGSYLETIVEAENSYNPFGKSASIKEGCKAYVENSERILLETFELNRKNSAKLFFDKCLVLLREKLDKMHDVHSLVVEATTEIERQTQNLINNVKSEKHFERSIHTFYKDVLEVKKADVNLQEAFNSINFGDILGIIRTDEIRKFIRNYVETTAAIQAVRNLSVEKVLSELPVDVRKNMIKYLDESSDVCIDLDTASFLQNTAKPTMEKFGFICVEDEDESAFKKDGDLYKKLSAGGGYNQLTTFGTGDSERITMIKVAGMFPANAIKKLKTHKGEFELSNSRGGYHFSDVYFERNAMDLIDVTDDDENLKWFAVGSALNIIGLYKRGIYLDYENKQKVPLFSGTRGTNDRSQCFDFFKKKKDFVSFVEKKFDVFYETKGKEEVAKILLEHYDKLDTIEVLGKQFENIDTQSDEYRHIFNERKAIKDFALSLGIDPVRFELAV